MGTREQVKETDLFMSKWDNLIDSIVEPTNFRLFLSWGIDITYSSTRMSTKKKDEDIVFEPVLFSEKDIVLFDVKTTMKIEYIKEFIEKLNQFKYFFPHYKNLTLYGAVAALRYDEESDKYAYRNGMFVLKSMGESLLKIANNKKFVATKF